MTKKTPPPKGKRRSKDKEPAPPRNKVPDSVTHAGTRNLLAHKMPNWKKGETGNKAGKPAGPNRATILNAVLQIPMSEAMKKKFLADLGIDCKGASLQEALDLSLIKKAVIDEDLKAIQEIKDTLHGKMAEVRKIGGDDEGVPIRVRRIIDDVPLDE